MKAKKLSQERDPRFKGLRQLKDLPAEGKPPGPSERALSKDEALQVLAKSMEECVDLANDASIDTVPILLFVKAALDQDDLPEMKMTMQDGSEMNYCHAGNGAGPILRLVAEHLHKTWNEIDAVRMKVFLLLNAIRDGKPLVLREPRA